MPQSAQEKLLYIDMQRQTHINSAIKFYEVNVIQDYSVQLTDLTNKCKQSAKLQQQLSEYRIEIKNNTQPLQHTISGHH